MIVARRGRRVVAATLVFVCAGLAPATAAAQDTPAAGPSSTGGEPIRPPVAEGADPNDWEAYFDRGVQLFREAPAEAGPYFYWASRLDPSRAEPLFARWANFLFRARNEDIYAIVRRDYSVFERPDFAKADSLRVRALMRNPFVHRGLESLAYDRLPGDFRGGRDVRAWIAYTEGKFKQAVEMHTRTIERGGPDAVWNRFDRSLASVAAGDLPSGLADLQELVAELRRREEAQALLEFYVSKEHLLYMIGLVHNQMGDRVASRDAFGEALLEDASFAYGYVGLAALDRAARRHADAAGEFSQAVALAGDDGYLHYLHAEVLFDLRRYAAAASALEQAIALEPWYALPHYLMGRVRERQGREDDAYPHYERFVALSTAGDSRAKSMRLRLRLRAQAAADTTSTRTP